MILLNQMKGGGYMARGRFISKEISLNEKVDNLSSDTARLLFTWLIPHLDCEGRMYADPQIFKSIVAPRRNYSINKIRKCLAEFENCGLIIKYFIDGNEYLHCPNFKKHQPGLQKDKESQSQIPPFTPDLLQSKSRFKHELSHSFSGVNPPQDKVKEEVKEKEEVEVEDEVEVASSSDIDSFFESIKPNYPDLDLDLEWKRFKLYWKESGKPLTKPKTRFIRWLEKARQFASNNTSSRAGPAYDSEDPNRFFTGKYQSLVSR